MPQNHHTSCGILGIRLEGGPRQSFVPGDTIFGCVYRTTPTVSPGASVTISLHGRSKSKLVVSTGQTTTTYRGRFNFFDNHANSYKIFDGPLHIEAGKPEANWRFAITIPSSFDHQALTRGVPEYRSYLPLNPQDVAAQPLPPSFAKGDGSSVESFVEYFLQADLRVNGHGSSEAHQAIHPVTVRTFSPAPPITNFELRQQNPLYGFVASQRLIPGMEDAKLTFGQKAQKFFGSSKVPVLLFHAMVATPGVIQLENPNPIPFHIRLKSLPQRTSEIIRDVPQKAKLTRLALYLKSDMAMRCEGAWSKSHDGYSCDKMDLRVGEALFSLRQNIFIPCAPNDPPVDIGKLLNLRIGHGGRIGKEGVFATVYPDFTTYNIKHSHRLKWELSVNIVDEEVKFMGQVPVAVLPPTDSRWAQPPPATPQTESWIHPPAEDVPPPSFAEAQGDKAVSTG